MLSRDGKQAKRWLRVARYAVLIVVAVFVVKLYRDRPSTVVVDYHYGKAATGLTAANIRYMREGEEVRRVRFNYTVAGAGDSQTHEVSLQDGPHTVEIDLYFKEKAPADLAGEPLTLETGGEGLRVTRVLPVQGAARVSIYIHKRD